MKAAFLCALTIAVTATALNDVRADDVPVRHLRVAKQEPALSVMEAHALWLRENDAKMESQWGGNIKPHAPKMESQWAGNIKPHVAKMEAHGHKPAKMEAARHDAHAKSETENHAVRAQVTVKMESLRHAGHANAQPRPKMEGQRGDQFKDLIDKIRDHAH